MKLTFIVVAAAIYASVGISQMIAIKQSRRTPGRTTMIGLGIATGLALGPLIATIYDGYALHLGVFNIFALTLLSAMTVILVLGLKYPTSSLGAFLSPITAASLFGLMQPSAVSIPVSDLTTGTVVHFVFAISALSFLLDAALQAALVAIQNKQLHQHNFKGLSAALPPLQTMEAVLFGYLWLGFVGLTVAIISGFVYLDDMFTQQVAHKTILSILAWIFFGVLLIGRTTLGWRGQKATRLTLIGFAILAVGYFGSEMVIQLVLNG